MNTTLKHLIALALAFGLVPGAHNQAMGEEMASNAAAKPAESAMAKLFGQELRNAQGEKVSVDKLDGKLVGIYFSAHWCPPWQMKFRGSHSSQTDTNCRCFSSSSPKP